MKVEAMNCRQVEAKLADWSADNLPDSFCEELRGHLRQCPSCAHHWNEFQHSLHVVSTSSQPCCSAERSHAMWQCCEQHIQKKVESERLNRNARSWWQLSPRLGLASLAGAFAVLIAVSLVPTKMLRHESSKPPVPVAVPQNTNAPRDEWIRFTLPPSQASSFINHHAAMAFDPFADHVASTLISDTATNPETATANADAPVAQLSSLSSLDSMRDTTARAQPSRP